MSPGATARKPTSPVLLERPLDLVRARRLWPCRRLSRRARLSGFDPKAPPPKTEAFWAIVDANRPPEDAELADILDAIGNPDATTILRIADAAPDAELAAWIRDRKNRRLIPHRLEKVGYVPVRNECRRRFVEGLRKAPGHLRKERVVHP